MRHVFDVTKEASVCGGGHAYRNLCGFQGAGDVQFILTLILNEGDHHRCADVVEFEGSGVAILEMLKSATSVVQATLDSVRRDGPVRETDCPNCDPMTYYPNATHKPDCAQHRFWEARKNQIAIQGEQQGGERG